MPYHLILGNQAYSSWSLRGWLLLDAFGSAKASKAFLAPMREAGVEVCWFHPVRLRWLWPWCR